MVTGDFSCKRRMRDRLWYGDLRRRRGVGKVLVRRNSLMIAGGRNAGRLPREETWVDVQWTKPSAGLGVSVRLRLLKVKRKLTSKD